MGIRQRLGLSTPNKKRATIAGSTPDKLTGGRPGKSALNTWFKKGIIKAPDLRDGAKEVAEHGNQCMKKLAKAGSNGKHRQNMSRDVMRNIETCRTFPYSTKIKFWDVDLDQQIEDDCFFMIPYEMIDDEIELSGAPVSDYCELPVDSPLRDTKKKWCEDLKTQDDNDIAIVGMWGGAQPNFSLAIRFVCCCSICCLDH